MTHFIYKISIFTPKISDDLFFSHRPGFSDFTFLYVSLLYRIRIRPFLHQKNHYFGQEFLDITIFYSVRTFARIRQHYFSKYWGNRCMDRSPTSNFGGDRPPVPPRSSPLLPLVILSSWKRLLFPLLSFS